MQLRRGPPIASYFSSYTVPPAATRQDVVPVRIMLFAVN
eukprot:SAG31_NODE_23771_length_496_cov_1.030227_1_plen_38_part_10